MEAKVIAIDQQPKVLTHKQILWATLLGGYLCGFYLIGQNYKAMGYSQLAKKALFGAIIVSLAIFIIPSFFLSEELLKRFSVFLNITQGLLTMTYLQYAHEKVLHNRNLTKEIFFVPLLAIAFLTAPFYLSEEIQHYISNASSFLFAFIPAAIADQFARSWQEPHIQELQQQGSVKYSNLRVFGIAFSFLLLQILFVIALYLLVEPLTNF
jgi:hypothetical protein